MVVDGISSCRVGCLFGVLLFVLVCLSVSVVADEEPYHYWYAPENSFGVDSTKDVNWSYFRQLFRNNFDVDLYYRVNGGDWQSGNQYLGVTFDWQDEGYWKINTSFDNPSHQTIDACFDITMKRNVLSYVERSEHYEYWLNYSVPGTDEVYNCFINWSDLMSIPGIQVSKFWTGNEFTLRFYKMNVPYGYHVFDPTFGETTGHTTYNMAIYGNSGSYDCYMRAIFDAPASSGTVDNISFYVDYKYGNSNKIQGALYEYVDYSSDYMGDQIAVTDNVTVSSTGWWTMDFQEPKPSITVSTNYYIAIKAMDDVEGTWCKIGVTQNDGDSVSDSHWSVIAWSDPFTGENKDSNYGEYSIYASYTESGAGWSNTCPNITSPNPANSSTGIGLYPSLNVTITDADGNNSKITWATNESGSWVNYQVNNSILNASVMDINASWADSYSTKYFWRIYANDTHCNASETFHFTTMAEPWSNTCPVSSSESPSNKSTGVNRQSDWSVVINDADGNTTSGSIDCSNGEGTTWSGQANGTRTLVLSTLDYDVNYTVWLNFTDGHCDVNETYWFVVQSNTCPTITAEVPVNTTDPVARWTSLNVTVSDVNVESCTVTFATNESGSWANYQVNASIQNQSVMDVNASWADSFDTKYWWKIYADDGNCNYSEIYWFVTSDTPWVNTCPVSSVESPSNGSSDVALCVGFWNVSINDADGNTTNGWITCSNGDSTSWSGQANGTRSLSLLCLNYSTNYTVWLNFTDGHCDVNETYWFVTVANTSGGCNCSLIEALEVRVAYLENMTNTSHGDYLEFLSSFGFSGETYVFFFWLMLAVVIILKKEVEEIILPTLLIIPFTFWMYNDYTVFHSEFYLLTSFIVCLLGIYKVWINRGAPK